MPFNLTDAEFRTLRQLDDTDQLWATPLDRTALVTLQTLRYAAEEGGWWRITPLGRQALRRTDDDTS